MPEPVIVSVSLARLAVPVAARFAPFAFNEFAQPLPATPAFAQGHAVPEPSPKQNALIGLDGVYSTTSRGRCAMTGFVRESKRLAVGCVASSVFKKSHPKLFAGVVSHDCTFAMSVAFV